MKRFSVIIAALIVHLMLGNICLNSVVHAYSPIEEASDAQMSADNMSQCPFINMSRNIPQAQIEEEQESPCASGNCYKQPQTETSSTSAMTKEIAPVALPVAVAFAPLHWVDYKLQPIIFESPPPLYTTSTIVLRM